MGIGTLETVPNFKVVITLTSIGDSPDVSMKVRFEPVEIEGEDFVKLGYYPSSYNFFEEYVFPVLEKGFDEWVADPMSKLEPPTQTRN